MPFSSNARVSACWSGRTWKRAGSGSLLSRADALIAVAESWPLTVAASDEGRGAAGLPVEPVVHVDHAALAASGDARDCRHTTDAAGIAGHASLAGGTPLDAHLAVQALPTPTDGRATHDS